MKHSIHYPRCPHFYWNSCWPILWRSLVALACVLVVGVALASCVAPGEVPVEEPAVEVEEAAPEPEEVEEEAPAAPEEPQVREIKLSIPAGFRQAMANVAEMQGWALPPFVEEHTVIYALPRATSAGMEQGIAFLLTPAALGELPAPQQILDDPASMQGVVLGALNVVLNINGYMPPDHYLITIEGESGKPLVAFTGETSRIVLDAVLRELPVPVGRPTALITANQMCLTWESTQVCAAVDSPPRSEMVERVKVALSALGLAQEDFNLDSIIPDVEGMDMLSTCADVLASDEPALEACQATVLAAPLWSGAPADTVEPIDDYSQRGLGVLVVLVSFDEYLYEDYSAPPPLEVLGTLSDGDYMVYEVLLSGQSPTPEEPLDTRVLLEGVNTRFYLPSLSGVQLIGDPVYGDLPPDSDEAVIVNLRVRSCCLFKRWECGN